jgi:Secretion system C-terminal sorting domain
MVRLIMQFGKTPSCNAQLPEKLAQRDTLKVIRPDTAQVKDPKKSPYAYPAYKIYPNPTEGMVYLDTDGSIGNIYLCDMNGKILSQIAINGRPRMQFDLTDYPAATYLLRYEYAPDKWLTSKIVKVH